MNQDKRSSVSYGPFGLTVRDIGLLSLLVIILSLGLILAYSLVQRQRALDAIPTATEVAQEPANDQPGAKIETSEPPTAEPTQENIPSPTHTLEATINSSTNIPPTSTRLPPTVSTQTPIKIPTAASILSPTPTATPTNPPIARAPFPSPPAQILYVQSNNQTHNLGLMTSMGSSINDNLHNYAAAPAWSPDGGKIAFFGEERITDLGGIYKQGSGVYLSDAQGQNPAPLVVPLVHVKNIAWSRDGRIAFEVGPPDIAPEIRIVDTNGYEISRFPGEQPAWSPDSQRRLYEDVTPVACGWSMWMALTPYN